ncbi:MAG TPA: hypothetical protein PK843_05120 [bacterium]|nr:hypothetical protein [bacterium]
MAVFIYQKLDQGLRRDALSTQIEVEIERRNDEVKVDESTAKAAQETLEKAAKAKKWWEF